MAKRNSFLDEDIEIDEKLFDNFSIDNIASWSHLELWCTIQNVEVDFKFFKGILCGASVISTLYDIILDAILNTDFLDKFLNEIEVIQLIEKLFIDKLICRTFKAKEFWVELAYNQKNDIHYNEYFSTGRNEDNNKKYKLLNAIFKKHPLTLLRFYDKFKMTIHSQDSKFERWLLTSFKQLSCTSMKYEKIVKALEAEISKQNKLSMFLN